MPPNSSVSVSANTPSSASLPARREGLVVLEMPLVRVRDHFRTQNLRISVRMASMVSSRPLSPKVMTPGWSAIILATFAFRLSP